MFNTESAKRTPFFAVDVNGPKPPNNAGEDLFTMLIMKNEGGSYYFHTNITYCLPVEKGGIETWTQSKAEDFMSAEEALKYGLIDGIMEKRA